VIALPPVLALVCRRCAALAPRAFEAAFLLAAEDDRWRFADQCAQAFDAETAARDRWRRRRRADSPVSFTLPATVTAVVRRWPRRFAGHRRRGHRRACSGASPGLSPASLRTFRAGRHGGRSLLRRYLTPREDAAAGGQEADELILDWWRRARDHRRHDATAALRRRRAWA
jgi:hypothetical protein